MSCVYVNIEDNIKEAVETSKHICAECVKKIGCKWHDKLVELSKIFPGLLAVHSCAHHDGSDTLSTKNTEPQ